MITKGLKNLAKELGCVVVLLTQLNRELEKRVNKRPLPSDSRDTGQIEQDCDYWVGIHQEGAFDDSVPPGETELILRLNRHGSTGTVYCNQINGAIYDTDQQAAAAERRGREQQPKKKGASDERQTGNSALSRNAPDLHCEGCGHRVRHDHQLHHQERYRSGAGQEDCAREQGLANGDLPPGDAGRARWYRAQLHQRNISGVPQQRGDEASIDGLGRVGV